MKIAISLLLLLSLTTDLLAQSEDFEDGHQRGLQSFLAPFVIAGPTFPLKENDAEGGLAFQAGAIFGFRTPALPAMGEFIELAYENRTVSKLPDIAQRTEMLSATYFSITPGLSYKGILNLGLKIGIPVSISHSVFSATEAWPTSGLDRSELMILVEPRVLLGYPIAINKYSRSALIVLFEAGYPLGRMLRDRTYNFNQLDFGAVRLPNLQLGLCYAFSLKGNRGPY